jgi:uncharacterized Zn-finger protein
MKQHTHIKLNTNNTNNIFCCDYCGKSYCNNSNLTRHKKTCTKLSELKQKYIQNIETIIDNDIKINKLSSNVAKMQKNTNVPNITINIQQNITNNTANITNNTANITNNIEMTTEEIFNNFWEQANIRPMGFEDLSGLNDQAIADKIHSYGLNCFVEFINLVYGKDINHNIALYNKREKLVKYVHKSGEIKIDSLVNVMSSVLMNLVDYLDTYLERKDIEIKPQYLPTIQKLKDTHAIEENPHLDRYNTHLYNRILNITNSSIKKMKEYDNKIKNELHDSLQELTLNMPSTDSRTEPDLTA